VYQRRKVYAFALDKPLISVETLAAMAKGVAHDNAMTAIYCCCPMIDARRMEVYTAVFNAAGELVKPTAAEIIDGNSFSDILAENKVLFFGDGADKCKDTLGDNPNAEFLPNFETRQHTLPNCCR
jgi:tRNA threonylcarbamoyladenosine biosynthesis protein TsaB